MTVARLYRNRWVVIAGLAIALTSLGVIWLRSRPTQPQTFREWCLPKNSLPATTRHTVEVLLAIMNTQDCNAAGKAADASAYQPNLLQLVLQDWLGRETYCKLWTLWNRVPFPRSEMAGLGNRLDLSHRQLVDLRPLATLAQIYRLDLSHNQIQDVGPLAAMTSVSQLNLSHNQIQEVAPLEPV
ncbi:MAG: leucine-rich repeat domain-containing protein [Thermosynechococcaceae cyanobacterium]